MARIKEITLEEKTYPVRGLNIELLEEHEDLLKTAFKVGSKEGRNDAKLLISLALKRANPDFDTDALWADYSFDYTEIVEALFVVAGLSGLDVRKAAAVGAGQPVPGEAKAAEVQPAADQVAASA